MNDKDFFIKLHQDYPLAYKHMEDNLKCEYSILTECGEPVECYKHPDSLVRGVLKYPVKRDLYDFFDGEEIELTVGITHYFIHCKEYPPDWDMTGGISEFNLTNRPSAEDKGFTKAFEILELRLTKE